MQHQLHLFRTARFGRKSEKGVVPEQMVIQFDEAVPVLIAEEQQPSETQTITYTRTKKNTGRKPLPQSLPYIEHVYDLSDEEKQCACGCSLTHIRDEVSEQLDVVPQMTFRVVHIRKQYACKACENTMKCAKKPKPPIPHSIATPGLIAAIINSKFRCHMPLYRQETMFNEAGISLVDELKELLDEATLKILPKSPLGQAVFYALAHWEALKSYLYDGRLEIDNNLSERAIKPFVIGRKNWLFHGNDIGARSGAVLYSLIETCKYHKVDAFSWFKYSLTHIQHANTMEQIEALLPYNINTLLLADLRRIPLLQFPE